MISLPLLIIAHHLQLRLLIHIQPTTAPKIQKTQYGRSKNRKNKGVVKDPPINAAAVDFIYQHRCLIDYFGGTYSPSMISFVWIGSLPSHHACVGGVIRVPFVIKY